MKEFDTAFSGKRLGNLNLWNIFIKSADYEGMYAKGVTTAKLIEHHVHLAMGGV